MLNAMMVAAEQAEQTNQKEPEFTKDDPVKEETQIKSLYQLLKKVKSHNVCLK